MAQIMKSMMEKYKGLPDGWENSAEGVRRIESVNLADRKAQLVRFYETTFDKSIERVDQILTNHKFGDVVKSLKNKYGKVPDGWEKAAGGSMLSSALSSFSGFFGSQDD